MLGVNCSVSVRLVNGSGLCSGRVEVKSNQSWASVCETDFDQRDAEVVCKELGCGAPSVLRGALYGELEVSNWTKEFHCKGDESLLLECGNSGSARNSCLPGKAVGLTCSGGSSSFGANFLLSMVRIMPGVKTISMKSDPKTEQAQILYRPTACVQFFALKHSDTAKLPNSTNVT